MKRSVFAIAASVLAVLIFAGANLASWKWMAPARLDFTENGLFTLSVSARKVVERLVEPVELELVYSRGLGADYPTVRAHAERVRELMKEIAARSGGKVKLRETDPEPFSETEDRITTAGLTPAPTDKGDPLYFGVIGSNSVDDHIAIPYLAPERDAMLEYELVRLIAQLDDPAPPKVAVVSSLAAFQGDGTGQNDAFVLREMRRAFEVLPVDPNFRALPQGTDVLLMVHPGPLDEWQSYVVDQFLMHHGRAIIAVDPVSRVSLATQGRRVFASSGLGKLSDVLEVSMGPDVAADRDLGLPIEVDAGGGRKTIEGQPLFPAAPRALMSATDPVTVDLSRAVNFGAAGSLQPTKNEHPGFTPLIETTKGAALIPAAIAMENPQPRVVMNSYKLQGASMTLAARVSGKLTSAFPNGPPPFPVDEDPVVAELQAQEKAHVEPFVSSSQGNPQIILISDSDVFEDAFYINPQTGAPMADNAAFILNALDNLGGDEALTALRSRAPAARPMERVDNLRAKARERLYKEQERLEALLKDAEGNLANLEKAGQGGVARTPQEIAEMAQFREQVSHIRRQLRGVEREFRRDIDALAFNLALINVWLPPIFAAVLGVGVFIWRGRGRRRPI